MQALLNFKILFRRSLFVLSATLDLLSNYLQRHSRGTTSDAGSSIDGQGHVKNGKLGDARICSILSELSLLENLATVVTHTRSGDQYRVLLSDELYPEYLNLPRGHGISYAITW